MKQVSPKYAYRISWRSEVKNTISRMTNVGHWKDDGAIEHNS